MAGYALRLSDSEMVRYQGMAQHAREAEAELWELAGLSAGELLRAAGLNVIEHRGRLTTSM